MGYRSDVCFEIRAKQGADKTVFDGVADKAKALLKRGDQEARDALGILLKFSTREMDDGAPMLRFFDESNKWYGEDDRAWAALQKAAEAAGCSVAFLRVGEDYGDIEELGSSDCLDYIPYITLINPKWLKERIFIDAYDIGDLAGANFGLNRDQFEALRSAGEKAAHDAIKAKALELGLEQRKVS